MNRSRYSAVETPIVKLKLHLPKWGVTMKNGHVTPPMVWCDRVGRVRLEYELYGVSKDLDIKVS